MNRKYPVGTRFYNLQPPTGMVRIRTTITAVVERNTVAERADRTAYDALINDGLDSPMFVAT